MDKRVLKTLVHMRFPLQQISNRAGQFVLHVGQKHIASKCSYKDESDYQCHWELFFGIS